MKRAAYSYIRFSSEKQSLGSSLERQTKAAREYAEKHNLELDTRTYQALGVSGFKGRDAEEGALASFLEAVKDKRIAAGSVLIVENMDRLSRDHVDRALAVFIGIISKGITIVTLTNPPQEFSSQSIRESSGINIMLAILEMVRANKESERKREFAIKTWEQRRAKDAIQTRVCPPWLEVNADKSAFLKLHKKVAIVQRIFQLSMNGMGAQLMATTFNREKVPQLGDAKEWRAQEFIRYLKWEAVKGTLVSKDRYTGAETNRIENYYPAIVSADDFALAQEAMRTRKSVGRGRKGLVVSNLFSGLIRCGSCGSGCRMTTKYGAYYLECLSARSKGVCTAPRFNYDQLEPALLWLIAAHERIELAPPSGKTADPRSIIRAELEEKTKRMERYLDDYETAGIRQAKLRIQKLNGEMAELEKRLNEWVPPRDISDSLSRAYALYMEHEHATKKSIEGAQKLWDDGFMQGEPRPEFDEDALREIRVKLQAGIKLLISGIKMQPKLFKRKNLGTFYREVEVIGPIVELLKRSVIEKYKFTEDGVLVEYDLPSYGFALTAREKEWKAQQENAVLALEAKHGIKTGLVDGSAKPKRKRKSLS